MTNAVQFLREVRQETKKITWPTRREVVMTTIVVLVMVTIVSTLLVISDSLIATGIEFILKQGK